MQKISKKGLVVAVCDSPLTSFEEFDQWDELMYEG